MLLVVVFVDLLRKPIPVALDAIQRQTELRTQDRIHRHERRMWEALVQILDDDARVVEHQIAIYQRRQAVIGVEVQQILGIATRHHIDDVDLDALFRQYDTCPVAVRLIGGGTAS